MDDESLLLTSLGDDDDDDDLARHEPNIFHGALVSVREQSGRR